MPDTRIAEVLQTPEPAAYEPPRVERVLTADDLTREVQYAGGVSVDDADSLPG